MINLEFSEADREALHYERYHHPHPQVQRKIDALYLKSQGLRHDQIRELCQIKSRTTLVMYFRRYAEGGFEALKALDYKGQSSQMNQHMASIKAHFAVQPPSNRRAPLLPRKLRLSGSQG